ncbi:MAG: hypothetical protein AAF619_09090 [Pseudomonadota bacterium]
MAEVTVGIRTMVFKAVVTKRPVLEMPVFEVAMIEMPLFELHIDDWRCLSGLDGYGLHSLSHW